MSRFRDGIYATPLYAGNGEAPPADEQAAPPEPGETTGPQPDAASEWIGEQFGYAGVAIDCNGRDAANPCGFPWYGNYYRGTYAVYDWILEHPVVQNARAQLFDAICSTPWGYEARKGVSKRNIDFYRGVMEDLRPQLLPDSLRALDYGWMSGEKVWQIRRGRYVLERVKPLEWAGARILKDRYGNFAGIVPRGATGGVNASDGTGEEGDWLGVHKSWLYTYDRKGQRHYGRSRLENVRATAWREWLDAATDMVRLGRKISGIMPILYTPAGEFRGSDNVTRKWATVATTALQAARNGLGIHLTHLGTSTVQAGIQNFDQLVALIKASAVRLEVVDFGNNAPAVAGIIGRMVHAEELMFHGYLRSPRTGMNTVGGTKADSQEHTDTADKNAESVHNTIVIAANQGLLDDLMTVNEGPDARGQIRIVPAGVSNEKRAVNLMILKSILDDPDMGPQYREQIDADAITDQLRIPKLEGVTITLNALDAEDADDDEGAADGEATDEADEADEPESDPDR